MEVPISDTRFFGQVNNSQPAPRSALAVQEAFPPPEEGPPSSPTGGAAILHSIYERAVTLPSVLSTAVHTTITAAGRAGVAPATLLPRRLAAVFGAAYGRVSALFSATVLPETAEEGQEPEHVSISSLPLPAHELVCASLSLEDLKAFSSINKAVHDHVCDCLALRCRQLRGANGQNQLLRRFGIDCPIGPAPTFAQMQAMIARIGTILNLMKWTLWLYSERPLQDCSAEDLVMSLPPERLQQALETAYRCNLCQFFAGIAEPPSCGVSLGEASKGILAQLATDEALGRTGLMVLDEHCTCIPSEIGLLKDLRSLQLRAIPITVLPPEIGLLSNLEELCLEYIRLAKDQPDAIPPELGQLRNLKKLVLCELPHATLPPELGHLEHLELLIVDNCGLKPLPPELGRLKNLKGLYLLDTSLATLPVEIGQLENLEHLTVANTDLKALPPTISQLKKLKRLRLNGDQFDSLPPELWQLEHLEELSLAGNKLKGLPAEEVARLKLLKQLYLDRNQLSGVPQALWQLENLEDLDLAQNRLEGLASGIGQLKRLKRLVLDQNSSLHELPTDLAQLKKLERISLRGLSLREPSAETLQLLRNQIVGREIEVVC